MRVRSSAVTRPWSLLLLGVLSLSPFYFWSSGLPQISHILAAFALGLRLLRKPRLYWVRGWGAGVAFVVYSSGVAIVVYARYLDPASILGPLYYWFNLCVFILIVTVCAEVGRGFLKPVFWIHACMLVGISIISITGIGRTYAHLRAMGTFNDPNQMANWILCCVCIVASIGKGLYGTWIPGLLATVTASMGVMFSASRSGSLGWLAVTAVIVFAAVGHWSHSIASGRGFSKIFKIAVLGFFSVVGLVVVFMVVRLAEPGTTTLGSGVFGRRATYLLSRLSEVSQGVGYASLSGRGYDRLWVFPEYLILGAGEGARARFAGKVWFLGEIHSSWAGLLFYYGVVGIAMLGVFVVFSLAKVRDCWHRLLLLGPVVYGFATYNVRNWYLWVALAIIVGSSVANNR